MLHLVSPTLMDHLRHALGTKAVSLVQGLQPHGIGVQLLLEIQARGFYLVLSTSHQDYAAVVHATRWVIERKLVLPSLTAVPVLVTSSAPTMASPVQSPVLLPVTKPISPASPAIYEAEGHTMTETAVSTSDTITCAALLDSPAPQEQATLDHDQNWIPTSPSLMNWMLRTR